MRKWGMKISGFFRSVHQEEDSSVREHLHRIWNVTVKLAPKGAPH